jgi:hypothetical protein
LLTSYVNPKVIIQKLMDALTILETGFLAIFLVPVLKNRRNPVSFPHTN